MKFIVIHHSAVHSSKPQLDAINNYHRKKWNMISRLGWYVGYNFVIDVDGAVTNTREIGEETMAQVGHNFDAISIGVVGDFNGHMPSEAQKRSLSDLIARLKKSHKGIKLKLHREMQAHRTCPGKLFTREYLETAVLGNGAKPDEEDEKKQAAIRAELAAQISLLQKLVKQLQELLKNYGKQKI